MYRIILMVVRLFYKVPYYLMRIWWLGTRKDFNLEENYAFIKKVTKAANRAGRVKIESYGLENIKSGTEENNGAFIRTAAVFFRRTSREYACTICTSGYQFGKAGRSVAQVYG